MKVYRNFKINNKLNAEQKKINEAIRALFLSDENGLDWYEAQKEFLDDTLKVQFNSDFVVTAFDNDISKLWPVDQSVAEVNAIDVPEGLSNNGTWIWKDGSIIPREYKKEELIEKAESLKRNLIANASTKIAPLQDAVDIEDATPEEVILLKLWKQYRVALNRIDVLLAPDINWPEAPDNVA
ncbi:tail fiber assembly protein [Escherichia coli]|nr:tail fiber assembly protein [Escherichia coli]